MPDAEHANLPEPSHTTILASSNVATGLPATDLARARRFYSEKDWPRTCRAAAGRALISRRERLLCALRVRGFGVWHPHANGLGG
jgi:hypothetical protein